MCEDLYLVGITNVDIKCKYSFLSLYVKLNLQVFKYFLSADEFTLIVVCADESAENR